MKSKSEKHTHNTASTTVQVSASQWPFSCRFFCNRVIDSDVIDPSKISAKESDEHPAIEPAAPRLRHK